MGKGDLRTKRGKIFRGTFGNTRLRKKKLTRAAGKKRDEAQLPIRPNPA